MFPYTSLNDVSIEDVRKHYLEQDTFSKMVDNLLGKDHYKNYTKESFSFQAFDIRYVGHEVWWLSWFAHHTYSKFDDERQAFNNFQDFLEEKGVKINYCGDYRNSNHEGYCAMGGEDRYRWELCKCEYCGKRGITTICH
jgi:hypothetical protein